MNRRSPNALFRRGFVRRGLAVVALLALSLVIARPICDAYAAGTGTPEPAQVVAHDHDANDHSHGDAPGPCCSSIDDGAVMGSATVVSVIGADSTPFMVLAARPWEAGPSAERRSALEPPDRPPLSLPYHARTTRLLI